MLFALDPPVTWRSWQIGLTGCDQEGVDQVTIVIGTQGFLTKRNNHNMPFQKIVLLHESQIGLMGLIIRCLIVSIGLHGLEIGQPHIQIFNCLLIVCNGLVRTKLLTKPKRATNTLGAIILITFIISCSVIAIII